MNELNRNNRYGVLHSRLLLRAAVWLLRSSESFKRPVNEIPVGKPLEFGQLVARIARSLRSKTPEISIEQLESLTSRALNDEENSTKNRKCLSWQLDSLSRISLKGLSKTEIVRELELLLPAELLRISTDGQPLPKVAVVENHIHLSGALSFQQVWLQLCSELPFLKRDELLSFQRNEDSAAFAYIPFGSLNALHRRLAACSLGTALLRRWNFGETAFAEFARTALANASSRMPDAWERLQAPSVLFNALTSLAEGEELQETGAGELQVFSTLLELEKLSSGSPTLKVSREEDDQLLSEFLTALRSGCSVDAFASSLFWQIQRVRCQLFAWLTQRPGSPGLSWFCEHFDRIDALHLTSSVDDVCKLSSICGRIDSLEIRRTPGGQNLEKAWALAKELGDRKLGGGNPVLGRFGIVLHYVKSKALESPLHNVTRVRFGDWYEKRISEAKEIAYQISSNEDFLFFFRGVDIANKELLVPNWAAFPLLRLPRKACNDRPEKRFRGVGVTLHAGEEFRSLNEGIRRVHEALEFSVLENGDRIGHALSIATDVVEWFNRNIGAYQPREERLWDLVWEYDLRTSTKASLCRGWGGAGRLRRIASDIQRLVCLLGWDDWLGKNRLEKLCALRTNLLNGTALEENGYPFLPLEPPKRIEAALAWRYLRSLPSLASEEVVADEDELDFLGQIQQRTIDIIRERQVTVEANPSSNLVVGGISGSDSHPALNLERLGVKICINSDDPITFATTLEKEYRVFYSALRRRYPAASKRDLDARFKAIMDSSLKSAFTLEESDDVAVVEQVLTRCFGRTRKTPC